MGFAPFGLGVLAWLAVERPWSRRLLEVDIEAVPEPGAESDGTVARERRGGWAGLGFGLLSAVLGYAAFWVARLDLSLGAQSGGECEGGPDPMLGAGVGAPGCLLRPGKYAGFGRRGAPG
jgi:hypothetical protein